MKQKQREKLIKNITKLSKKINMYKKYGKNVKDFRLSMTGVFSDVENFDTSLLTKYGNISKSYKKWSKHINSVLKENKDYNASDIINEIFTDLNNKLPTLVKLKDIAETSSSTAAVEEFFAKRDIDSYLDAFRTQYYDIVNVIAAENNMDLAEAETLLQDATNSIYAEETSANEFVKKVSDWGSEYRKIEKDKNPTMTYRQAVQELNAFSDNISDVKDLVKKYLEKTGGQR